MNTIISAKELKKYYKRPINKGNQGILKKFFFPQYEPVPAVDDISFEINSGERVAFLGPNGAGKSTTIKILTGIIQPTSGQVNVLALDPIEDRRKLSYKVGSVFGQRSQLFLDLSPINSFKLLGKIYEIENTLFNKRLNKLIDLFQVQKVVDQPARSLSLGERMRCDLVASLIHNPQILFLDEPTIGLDVNVKAVIRDLIISMAEDEGITIFLTSHDAGDIEKVSERVILINHGKILEDTTVSEIKQRFTVKKQITLHMEDKDSPIIAEGSTLKLKKPHELTYEVDTKKLSVNEFISLAMKERKIKDISIESVPLEEVLRGLYHETN